MDAARRERRHHRKAAAAAAAATAAAGMAPVGTGGGAAAAARAAYGDVFRGPPRFAAPFGAAPVDYAEVFGGVAAACSIPFLDLPPAAAVGGDDDFFACKGKGDYGEIFARFDFADFALPYEDLFAAPEPERDPEVEEIASSSGSSRSSIYKESIQLEDEAPILPQQYQNLDSVHHLKEHKVSPISFRQDTASQQFVMSYNKTTERRPDDLVEMSTVEPSKEYVIDSRNLSRGPETNHVSRFYNGTMVNSDNEKNISAASVSARSPDSEFAVGQKQQSPSCTPISGSVSANENHTSPETNHVSRFVNDTMANSNNEKNTSFASVATRSPEREFAAGQKQQSPAWPPISVSVSANKKHFDSHSTHSSATPPDYAFLRVSDDAQTQPIKLQPSSRQQPNLLKENAAKGGANHANQFIPTSVHTTSRSNVPQADKKADADASPTSASAAMKEAMDFAEARLKAAKELLERKGDSFKLRKKPSHHRSTRSTEIKAPVPVEVDSSEQKLSTKKSLKEEKNVEDSLSDKHKKISAYRSDHSDERVLEKPQQMIEPCTESCQASSKIEKLGNWSSGDEFYELTGDDQKYKIDKATVDDGNCKQTNLITSPSKDKKSEPEFSATDPDLERYEKLWEITWHAKKFLVQSLMDLQYQENAKENLDDVNDECVELPSVNYTSSKLDSTKDTSDSLSEDYSSVNHASVLRDLGNCSPNVSSVSGTSQEHTNSDLAPEVPCDGGVQCTSGINEQLQETPEVSNPDISRLSNIKSLIQEELGGSYVYDSSPRGVSTVDQEVDTYGREKFSFISESFLHNDGAELKEVPFEEVQKAEIEKKNGPCAHPEETVVDLNAERPEEGNITLQNEKLADSEESDMLNVFEVASKLIKRDMDQGPRESLGHGEVDSRMEEGGNGSNAALKSKEAEETPLENRDKTSTEGGPTHGNLYTKSSESTIRGQSDLGAKCNTTVEEVGSESFSGVASDSTSRTSITPQDETASSSGMYTKQHSVQKDKTATSQTSNKSAPDVKETGEICREGEGELPGEKSTCEENKNRANKMEGNYTTSRIPKAEQPSPLEKTRSLPKSAEGPTSVSAEAMKKETLGVRRANERDNVRRTESTSEKDKGCSQRTEEAKESERRSQKERELAEERERRKLEEEERERERKKDRLAVERATREAHERAFAEAREKAEKMAFERISAARQRASAEAREKEERASAEARIKAERAAVERATAEARERAIEKAKAEKALAEARERRERYRSSFKERSTNQDLRQDMQFQRAASSNFNRNPDSSYKVVEVESALRHKARLERHQRTAERVTKALAEKNMRDLKAQREQAEKHRLSEFLDPEIKRWSNGKEGNLRALLSTLQYILGAESGWQPVPLTDLITAAAVKKAYRKATLCVHPDKLQQRGATIRQKYICEKVFDLLKDAWNKFTSEER
ncbi:hypothetical protein QOZ80_5AG0361900 [Eleusine coracana subsp. coracana]|nr:hypothetical protein QOZ80_5AG0361900 [Eleusine coracana subsp. coracana]